MSQLTLTTLPQPVIDAIKVRLTHTGGEWTVGDYVRRSFVCRERWPQWLRMAGYGFRYSLELRAESLRDFLEKKGDEGRREWIDLAMLEFILQNDDSFPVKVDK